MSALQNRIVRLRHLSAMTFNVLFEHGPLVFIHRLRWKLQKKPGYPPMRLAYRYCKGVGVEFGAASYNAFDLPGAMNVAPFSDDPDSPSYQDFLIYKEHQVSLVGHYSKIDLVGYAEDVPVEDASQDYVLSSHVIEHLPNLIAAFLEWNRILKPQGIVFMIFPKRDALPNDAKRPITPLEHFIEDYYSKQTIDTHPVPEGDRIGGHYHVFTVDTVLKLIDWCNQNVQLAWKVEHVEKTDSKVGNGHTIVCRYVPGYTNQ
jgi:SAM-dependent methyltransferase